MNFFSKPVTFMLFFISTSGFLTSCVTTRAQLNEERGIVETQDEPVDVRSKNSVKSEDLGSASSEPARGEAPMTSQAPSTPQVGPYVPPPAPVGGYGAEELRAEIARLNGRVEELEHEKKMKEEERTTEQKRLQDQVVGLEKQLKDTTPQAVEAPEGKSTFEAGKDAYFGALFEQAIQYMDQFLQKSENAKDADQKQVAEAIYIRGESYFKRKEYKKAIVDFSKFPEKFQKSAYHPKALLRIAESFEAMGMKEDAKAFYQELSDQFAKTAEGKLAKKRLKKK